MGNLGNGMKITIDEATVSGEAVERYVKRGYKLIETITRNYWNKPNLYILRRITRGTHHG